MREHDGSGEPDGPQAATESRRMAGAKGLASANLVVINFQGISFFQMTLTSSVTHQISGFETCAYMYFFDVTCLSPSYDEPALAIALALYGPRRF